ncbi:MAG: hypothetical protein SPI30_07090 [Prevotella sp.]|nr:hypothetical protein [Prevotella sp.]
MSKKRQRRCRQIDEISWKATASAKNVAWAVSWLIGFKRNQYSL